MLHMALRTWACGLGLDLSQWAVSGLGISAALRLGRGGGWKGEVASTAGTPSANAGAAACGWADTGAARACGCEHYGRVWCGMSTIVLRLAVSALRTQTT
jgi:hypothetical protein